MILTWMVDTFIGTSVDFRGTFYGSFREECLKSCHRAGALVSSRGPTRGAKFRFCLLALRVAQRWEKERVDNPRASYRAENPTNPKIGQKYHTNSPYGRGSKKYPENTRKIPPKYEFRIFWVFQGVFEGVFRGVSCFDSFVCGGVFLHFAGFPIL